MGREIRLIRALADEGYQYGLNDGVPPIPRDGWSRSPSLPKHLAQRFMDEIEAGGIPVVMLRGDGQINPDGSATTTCSSRPRSRRSSSSATRDARDALRARRRRLARGVHPRARGDPAAQPPVRALLQRHDAARASASTARSSARSGRAWSILLGVGPDDTEAIADDLARKVAELRIFRDDEGRTNRSLLDIGGRGAGRLAVHAVRRHAPRPPARVHRRRATRARRAAATSGSPRRCAALGVTVATGRFGAEMAVELVNDGPFTIWLDSDDR